MDLAEERQHVVFAHAEHLNVLDDNHFVIVHIKQGAADHLVRVFAHAFGQVLQGFLHTLRRSEQAVSLRIFPQPQQQLTQQLLRAGLGQWGRIVQFLHNSSCLHSNLLGANFPAARVFERIEHGLFHANLLHLRMMKALPQDVVDPDAKVLRGGHNALKHRQRIEVLVAKTFQNICIYKGVQIGQIAHHPRTWIDLAGHGDLHRVIVSVPVGIVAFAVYGLVLLIGHGIGV